MSGAVVITGTDTEVGKTVFAAALSGALGSHYRKPVQAGLDDGSDAERVAALSGLPADRILPEAYRLTTPCSPHRPAEIDGIKVGSARLDIPSLRPLVIEGAGGVMVPLSREFLFADLFARWRVPVVIVARTSLGTINHSLLTIEALRARHVQIHGIVFVGNEQPDTEETIVAISGVWRLGRLPLLSPLTPETLDSAFRQNFQLGDFV